MNTSQQKHIGEAPLSKKPEKPLSFMIGDKRVKERHLDDKAVSARTIGDDVIPTHVRPITDKLQQLIDSFNDHGVSVSNEFGSNSHIGVSQKTLTEAFNKLWQKIEDMTGEQIQGIQMVVTPDYFISEDGCQIHISANTVETNGVFEHIAFYSNGELIAEADNTDLFEYETSITETSVIKCVAKIMGIEYMQQKVVTHYNSFWLGAGSVYTDIMDVDHVIPITNGMRGAYDVEVADGQRIIIIVGDTLKDSFLRADLNSVEIPFTETSVTVDGKDYRVYMSEPWSAGSYNIDING